MLDKKDTQLHRLLFPTLVKCLRDYFVKATVDDKIMEQGEGVTISSYEDDADVLIQTLVESLYTGSPLTEERSKKVWFILDFCYSIAKRAIYQVIKGKVDDFTVVELIWLVWAQVDTRVVLRNREEQWKSFQNKLLVDNLDED
jgi:hypothetical protein